MKKVFAVIFAFLLLPLSASAQTYAGTADDTKVAQAANFTSSSSPYGTDIRPSGESGSTMVLTTELKTIAAPAEVKLGDTCTYNHHDGYNNKVKYTIKNTVTAMDDKTITLTTERVNPDGSVRHGRRIVDHNLNTLELSSGKMNPYYPGFSFPLFPGKKVDEETVTYPGRNGTVTATFESKAGEWKTMKVAAGEFKVLNIDQTGYYTNTGGGRGTITDIISVSPVTWCHVRWETKIDKEWSYRELVSFTRHQ
jgi:hypothetical protein